MTVSSHIGENELRAILALAEKAAPGPWYADSQPTQSGLCLVDNGTSGMHPVRAEWHEGWFIAAANPDTIRSIVTELLDRRSAGLGTVSVKDLQWREEVEGYWWTADFYKIEAGRDGIFTLYAIVPGASGKNRNAGRFHLLEAAKSAAQSDFETRVKSCLTSIGVENQITRRPADWQATLVAAFLNGIEWTNVNSTGSNEAKVAATNYAESTVAGMIETDGIGVEAGK